MDTNKTCESILEFANNFDKKIGEVIDSSTKEKHQFHLGKTIQSLLDCGVDFYIVLKILSQIEDKIKTNIETKDISEAIIFELDKNDAIHAKEFRIKYNDGILIDKGGPEKIQLCMSEIRKIAIEKLENIEYKWGRRKYIDEVSNSLITRIRKLNISEISTSLLDQLWEQELNERLEGKSLNEYKNEIPSILASKFEIILRTYFKEIKSSSEEILSVLQKVSQAILIYFGMIPPKDLNECLISTVDILEKATETNNPLRVSLLNFLTVFKERNQQSITFNKSFNLTKIIENLISAFRKLSFLTKKDSLEPDKTKKEIDNLLITYSLCLFLFASFATFLWPEDSLTASTYQKLRKDILRYLFRYRCISIDKLTKILQVHPKHTMRALVQLKRDNLITTHKLIDGELVLITTKGEKHCEANLGFRLRYSLSGL